MSAEDVASMYRSNTVPSQPVRTSTNPLPVKVATPLPRDDVLVAMYQPKPATPQAVGTASRGNTGISTGFSSLAPAPSTASASVPTVATDPSEAALAAAYVAGLRAGRAGATSYAGPPAP